MMPEIVVESSAEVAATTTEEPRSRAARRRRRRGRRMDPRRLRIFSSLTSPAPCVKRKRNEEEEHDHHHQQQQQRREEFPCPGYGMMSVCGRRRDMEDAVSIRPDFSSVKRGLHFFAVFDGHGCSHVAMSCKDRMHEVVAAEIGRGGDGDDEWKRVMGRSFRKMEMELACHVSGGGGEGKPSCKCELLQANNCDHVGSTAVVAVVTAEEVVVANCGDSRAVLCRGGVPVALSEDHKPDRPDELRRIQELGGRVIYWDGARVLGVLAMSRAIGDKLLKPYVTSEPDVTVTERAEDDEFLILASDGLWDVVSNKMACEVVRMCLQETGPETLVAPSETMEDKKGKNRQGGSDKACRDAAFLLTKLAIARHSFDNVSIVVVDLRSVSRTRKRRTTADSAISQL